MVNLPQFTMQTGYNPLRAHYDLLVHLKLRTFKNNNQPLVAELSELQFDPIHLYKGKQARKKTHGLEVPGSKKLITDYAFYQDIVVKMHYIKEAQDQV